MARIDPLHSAAAAYTADQWDEQSWRQFGRDTGTSDILINHPRLYRSLSFGDSDYPDAAMEVLGRVLDEAVEDGSGEKGRMELLVDAMEDLPTWVATKAPARTKRLFDEYIAARDLSEIPSRWITSHYDAVPPWETEPFVAVPWETEPVADVPSWETDETTRSVPVIVDAKSVEEEAPAPQLATPTEPGPAAAPAPLPNIFIVHGHDEAARDSIRIYVHKLTGVMPISLAEEPGKGATIIEKFEKHGAEASFVIVLLTPDDVGQTVAAKEAGTTPNPRARQNVVLELGYFIGKIGRDRIVVVNANVERPSDLAGLSYVEYPGTNWKDDLRVELQAAALTF